MLILVVGPSGAGKDTLLAGARRALAADERFHFARRVITRPADAGAEDHEPATEAEFLRRAFALQWQAHGLRYGIPIDVIAMLHRRRIVIASISRSIIAAAAARFPVRVIEVIAPPELLAHRLAARGREDGAGIASRLVRQVDLPAGIRIETVVNDGTIEEGTQRFLTALCRVLRA
ncbi:MAG TPA: phosphonate metabolism protein/1,5-bisphosphokinase (PRPP-forming) PhnN [Rhodopila sp.]|nr:phosphonate metabolism protein/1,5-bisphosphokinase (PRPP-forming) PhnN [Rhodopila sp.]